MRGYVRSSPRWLLAAILALAVGGGVFSWLRLVKKAEPEDAPPLRLSDVEGQTVPIPSLPSIQMHLIPRTQPTPLSPVTSWKAANRDRPTTPVKP